MASLENLRKFREILLQTGNEPEINKQDGITLDDFHFPDKEPAPLPELWEPGTVRREPDIEEPPVVEPEPDLQPEPETQQPEPARQPEPETRQPEPETQQPATDRKPETGNRQPATDRKPEPETRQPEPDLDDDIDLPDGAGFDMDFGDLAVPPEALTHPEVPEAVPEEAPEEAETIDLSESDLSALSEAIDGAAALPESEIPAGIPEDIDLSGLGAEDGGTVPEDIDLSGLGAEDGGIVPEDIDLSGLGAEDGGTVPEDIDLSGLMPPEETALASAGVDASEEEASSLAAETALTDDAPEDAAASPEAAADDLAALLNAGGIGAEPETPEPETPEPDAAQEAAEAAPSDAPEGLPSIDDLGITGFDDAAAGAAGADLDGADTLPAAPSAEEAESAPPPELSEEDLKELLNTLDSYPLALRIACEEIISGDFPQRVKSKLITLLVNGGSPVEAAELASYVSKKTIPLPKGAVKKTAEELEAEKKSFKYIFFNKFLPIFTLALILGALAASVSYLAYQFIYKPVRAETLYKQGYEAIGKGQYERANQCFADALKLRRVKDWFYKYAEAFRDEKQYVHAERKYDELLRVYPKDKKGALDYADMESRYIHNYEKADRVIRANILDYNADDIDALIALGDINLEWGDSDPEEYYDRYEQARLSYVRVITISGQSPPLMERMLKYFIRTDNLREVIPIQKSFMDAPKVSISPSTLAELGGYLLDKRLSQTEGISDAEIDKIEGIKDVLIRATELDEKQRIAIHKKTKRAPPPLPEPHYQLGRYYNFYNSPLDERQALETAAAAFDAALIETPKRTRYRIDNQRLLANSMIRQLEWIDAEEALAKGVGIYENALERSLIKRRYADAGKLYEALGNIEYFIKNRDMNNAIRFYRAAERNEWSPPEMRYKTGAAYYQLGDYPAALERFFDVSMSIPYNRRLLHALGNVSYLRNDFFAAQGYYNRLIGILENDRRRIPALTPDERIDHADLLRRMMEAFNNMGVTLNALAARTGNPVFRAEALASLSEAARYWENTSRNENFVRPGLEDPGLPGKGLPYLNMRQILYPLPGGGNLLLYNNIDKDVLEPSEWEELASKTPKTGGM